MSLGLQERALDRHEDRVCADGGIRCGMTAEMNDGSEYVTVRSAARSRVDVTVRSPCLYAKVSAHRVFLTLARLVRQGRSRHGKDHQNDEKDQRKPSHSYPLSSSPFRREAALAPEAIEDRTTQQEKSRLVKPHVLTRISEWADRRVNRPYRHMCAS